MSIDPRAKGARAETLIRDQLRKLTGLQFERVPSSGALDPKHGLKGDLYLVGEKNAYCIEVKSYADDHLTSSLLTGKNPQFFEWWQQAVRQGQQVSKTPLLVFKHDRSKVFCAFEQMPTTDYRYLFVSACGYEVYVALLDDFVKHEQPKFILE